MRLVYRFCDYQSNSSSTSYDPHEQDQAISSAKNQISIANEIMKSTTSEISVRASALVNVANDYVSQMNKITSRALSSSSSSYLSRADGPRELGNENNSYSGVASASSASTSSASVGQILVSLKSNVGTIYSLVNKRNSSN